MIIESAIAGATACFLGACWLAHKIVRATLEDKERAEKREDDRSERDRPPLTVTPEIARAARAAVAEKRKILLEQRGHFRDRADMWDTQWRAQGDKAGHLCDNMNNARTEALSIDKRLLSLADEEAKIPLFDDESSK